MAPTSAWPIRTPARYPAVTIPRSRSRNTRDTALALAGNATDCPTPNASRDAISVKAPVANPVSAEAVDQNANPAAYAHLTPKRSTNQPAGTCMNA